MNKIILSICLTAALAFQAKAQESIEGMWLTAEGNVKVEIYQKGEYHFGKVVWMKQATDKKGNALTDRNNPDKSLRKQPIMGLDMLRNLKYKKGKWYGKIYAPKRGLTMDVEIELQKNSELGLNISYRGFNRGQTWARTTL